MSKPKPCPKCKSRKRQTGYGFGGGVFGAYAYCGAAKCGILLELEPDLSALPEDMHVAALAQVKKNLEEALA